MEQVADEMELYPDAEAPDAPSGAMPITLPDELVEWAMRNHELIMRFQNALSQSYDTLTEEQLWEAVAADHSTEWQLARQKLLIADRNWTEINRPENIPLGLIGNALECEETNQAWEQYALSLADFTIINEGLRQNDHLNNLFRVLLAQKRMIDISMERTRKLLEATAQLQAITEDVTSGTHIREQFRLYARRLLTRTFRNAPVPSSPEI